MKASSLDYNMNNTLGVIEEAVNEIKAEVVAYESSNEIIRTYTIQFIGHHSKVVSGFYTFIYIQGLSILDNFRHRSSIAKLEKLSSNCRLTHVKVDFVYITYL